MQLQTKACSCWGTRGSGTLHLGPLQVRDAEKRKERRDPGPWLQELSQGGLLCAWALSLCLRLAVLGVALTARFLSLLLVSSCPSACIFLGLAWASRVLGSMWTLTQACWMTLGQFRDPESPHL